jgi:hypothetical protein
MKILLVKRLNAFNTNKVIEFEQAVIEENCAFLGLD